MDLLLRITKKLDNINHSTGENAGVPWLRTKAMKETPAGLIKRVLHNKKCHTKAALFIS